ncbi:MAG: hypothetical protein GY749_36660 [Desulfobacteraceae bacterium]|nr:hypothetical protein [Desulfobacteraceae bacterium]
MEFRQRYIKTVGIEWPIRETGASRIFSTIARTIQKRGDNGPILNQIIESIDNFDSDHTNILRNQSSFDEWFFLQINIFQKIPFCWSQAKKKKDERPVQHKNLSFGAVQKFLCLGLKDWWAVSPSAQNNDGCRYLFAPFDKVMHDSITRYFGKSEKYKSLTGNQSYVYHLSKDDFITYQKHLSELGDRLNTTLGLKTSLSRIEVEQLIWGWV